MSQVIFLRIVNGGDGAASVIAGVQGGPFSGLCHEPRPPAAARKEDKLMRCEKNRVEG